MLLFTQCPIRLYNNRHTHVQHIIHYYYQSINNYQQMFTLLWNSHGTVNNFILFTRYSKQRCVITLNNTKMCIFKTIDNTFDREKNYHDRSKSKKTLLSTWGIIQLNTNHRRLMFSQKSLPPPSITHPKSTILPHKKSSNDIMPVKRNR